MLVESVQIGVRALSTVSRWAAPELVHLTPELVRLRMLGAAVIMVA